MKLHQMPRRVTLVPACVRHSGGERVSMSANPVTGVILHAIGGLAAGSFYIPYKAVKRWSWESLLARGGRVQLGRGRRGSSRHFSCRTCAPCWTAAPASSLAWTYAFGVLWGIGGLTFRAIHALPRFCPLGYALALGFCAAFGTVIPPLFGGEMPKLLAENLGPRDARRCPRLPGRHCGLWARGHRQRGRTQ